MTDYESTLREAVLFAGVGLHTGEACQVRVLPSLAGSGLQFVRSGVEIPALSEFVVETARATVLGRDGVSVSTVEHLLAALMGAGVCNARLEVEGPEIPVMDGSAQHFFDRIMAAGIAAQSRVRARFVPLVPAFVRDGDRVIAVLPAAAFRVKFVADFAAPIGTQYFDGEISAASFNAEIAAARTFGYLHEVQALLDRGLAKGGTLENAVVFAPEGPMQPLRWPDEPVRHKVLDLLGDFALLGAWPQCEVIAIKSGHRLHCLATTQLRAAMNEPRASAQVGG